MARLCHDGLPSGVMSAELPVAEPPRARWVIGLLTLVVIFAVLGVMAFAPGVPSASNSPTPLATLNVLLNAAAGVALLVGYFYIRRGQVAQHRRCMLAAFGLSTVFLLSYLLHHARVGSVPFAGTGAWRTLYFSILVPHIVLAAGIVPLALFTIYRGWTGRIAAHRKVARWTFPIWIYVSFSGVAVYWLLYR
jgi:putative membrane protein